MVNSRDTLVPVSGLSTLYFGCTNKMCADTTTPVDINVYDNFVKFVFVKVVTVAHILERHAEETL